MLRELFQDVWERAAKAALPRAVRPDGEPGHVYLLATPDGKVERRIAEPDPRNHTVGDLDSLVSLVNTYHAQRLYKDAESNIVLWYNRQRVVLLMDDSNRRDRVTLPLAFHPQLALLQSLESKDVQFTQKEFVSLLRIKLAGCLELASGFLDAVRLIKFKKNEAGESIIQHGKASLGRSVQAELTGAAKIPESVELQVPVFGGPLMISRSSIECAIDIDPETEKFRLIPLPGEIETAICAAESGIGEKLQELLSEKGDSESIGIFYGTP